MSFNWFLWYWSSFVPSAGADAANWHGLPRLTADCARRMAGSIRVNT